MCSDDKIPCISCVGHQGVVCLLMPYRKRRIQLYIVELTCDASLSVTISVHMALYSANTRQRFQNLIAEASGGPAAMAEAKMLNVSLRLLSQVEKANTVLISCRKLQAHGSSPRTPGAGADGSPTAVVKAKI